ncbi:glycosyltransferase [Pseudoalteromonas obscura]|uniref:Glycosyltransferase n=1 Tax=Pseudoalteromonas obscura TaxID=3048491 RepID=A0ABT7ERD4_9GAMM|nr:glycosyltransferase [Pseudoalteromonas sp. P94(2023)]MDK2597607.1 glycosyltransferase [Pseudoalteromonas sp. P94(2023)]
MKSSPLVSVAIITYNQKDFLKECIESILAQSYSNVQIVVADDCSSDGTQEMLREYDEQYPGKFTLCLSEKNRGITANSNAANDACIGQYIAWTGGDDLMLPNKLSRQVDYMEKHPEVAICYHDLDVFESDTNKTIRKFSEGATPRRGGIEKLMRYGCFLGAASAMVRNSDKLPSYDNRMPIASDWMYWIRCLEDGGTIEYIPEVLGRYRRHSNNVTSASKKVHGSALQDHFITCAILKSEFPKYISSILKRESDLLNQCANYDVDEKKSYQVSALKNNFRLKVLYRLLFK